jgi:hypothetical protein
MLRVASRMHMHQTSRVATGTTHIGPRFQVPF